MDLSLVKTIADNLRIELLDAAVVSTDLDGVELEDTFSLGEGVTDALPRQLQDHSGVHGPAEPDKRAWGPSTT